MKYLLSLILLFNSFVAKAQTIDLESLQSGSKIGKYLYIFEDKKNVLDFDDIRTMPLKSFHLQDTDVPTFGLKPFTFWARFTIKNSSDKPVSRILTYDYIMSDFVSLYQANEDGEYK